MRIVDIFRSRQGEGQWTGVESAFARVGGCNLRCTFCDTDYASWKNDEGEDLSVSEIAGRLLLLDSEHVVLTGGEPFLYSELIPLTQLLKEKNRIITVETAGTIEIPISCDLISISPKLSNSTPIDAPPALIKLHESNRFRPDIVNRLMKQFDYQLKFAVDQPEDLLELEEYLCRLDRVECRKIWLMPVATELSVMHEKAQWIIPYTMKRGFHYCPRMQLQWYGNRRRT